MESRSASQQPASGDPTGGSTARTTEATRPGPVISDPAPLGLGAFALTTFLLSLFNAGLLNEAGEPVVLGLALAYGGLAQLLAGMWEFRTGNTFGATAFASYGAFWISFALLVLFFEKQIPDAQVPNAVGWYLIGWGIFTSYMFVASLRTTAAIATVFILLALTFLLLGFGDLLGADVIARIGGFAGLVTAAAAWYASFAVVTNATAGRTILPVKPLGQQDTRRPGPATAESPGR